VINAQAKKERFLRDPIPVRLGGLAANLARVDSFSQNPANQAAVFDLFEESKYFIEWTAAETEIETAVELIELQLQIAIWQRNWQKNWEDVKVRKSVANTSTDWSQHLLERSGLLNR
jgi:hypothetical protein